MQNLLLFLNNGSTTNTITIEECGESTLFAFQIARLVIRILQIAVPFALIIWGSLDFFKAVIAGDEKEMKQKRKPFIQRLIAAIIILILPIILNAIMKTLASDKQSKFIECWNAANPSNSGGITLPENSGEVDY